MHLTSRLLRAVALGATAAVAITACGGTNGPGSKEKAPTDQQVYRVNDSTEPNSFDPGQETYTYEAAFGRVVFEPLLRPNHNNTDVEGLTADSYSVSSDGLKYTFHIRSNAKWSDGKKVVAGDFVYGWQRLLNPAYAAGYVDPFFDQNIAGGANYANVSPTDAGAIQKFISGLGLAAPDDSHFEVTLAHKAPFFKWVATLWVGAPIRKDLVDAAAGGTEPLTDTTKAEAWASDPTKIVGNGPFKAVDNVAKDHVTLAPNPNYWGGAPTLQKITYYYIEDANTAFSKYRTNELDQITVPAALSTTVANDAKLKNELIKIPTLSTFWLTYNTKTAPLDNEKVRLALAKSIDRGKLAADVEHGQARSTTSFIPQGMNGYDESVGSAQKFDPSAAKKLLQDSGVDPAALGKLKLLTRNTTRNTTINQFIQAQWQTNLGVNIPLEVIDSKTVTKRIRKGQFDIYGPDGWGADYPDQQDWADIFVSGSCHSLNWGCPNLPGYDDLVSKADTESSESQRNSDYKKAFKQIFDTGSVAILFQSLEWDLVKPYVQIQYTNSDDEGLPGDFRYHDAYITKH